MSSQASGGPIGSVAALSLGVAMYFTLTFFFFLAQSDKAMLMMAERIGQGMTKEEAFKAFPHGI